MKVYAAVLALVAIAFSAAPVMASVASSAGSDSVFQANAHRHHHHRRHHRFADEVRGDVADSAAAIG